MENTLRNFIRKILFENFIVQEDLTSVEANITSPKVKADAETMAKKMAERGRNSFYTLDSAPPQVLKLAVELLVDAYKQGEGEYILPNTKQTFQINKENIEQSIAIAFDPSAENFGKFLGQKGYKWAVDDFEIQDRVADYWRGNMKHKSAIEDYQKQTGQTDVPSKVKYLINKYITSSGGLSSFYEYAQDGLVGAARGYFELAPKEKTLSLDAPLSSKGTTTHGERMAGEEEPGGASEPKIEPRPEPEIEKRMEKSSSMMGGKVKSIINKMVESMIKSKKINPSYISFIKLKTLVVTEYPKDDTTHKRMARMIDLHNHGLLKQDLQSFMDTRKAHVEKNPQANTYFKEPARNAYSVAMAFVNEVEEFAKQEGLPSGMGQYLIENVLGMPLRANGLLFLIALEAGTSPIDVMKKFEISKKRLIQVFEKIQLDSSKLNSIVDELDIAILEEIINSNTPIQTMKSLRVKKSEFIDLLKKQGKSQEEADKVFNAISKISANQPMTPDEESDVNQVFADPSKVAELNEEELLEVEEPGKDVDTVFPTLNDMAWVVQQYRK